MEQKQNGDDGITPLAITNWRDIRRKFGIKQKNRRGHIYIIGKSGTGKSSLMGNMMISDLAAGYGLALIDPHGDLAETILHHVPEDRIEDVVHLNAADFEYPVAFNPLEPISKDKEHLVVSGLISVFKKIWPEFWGPRMEHILRHALLTLVEVPNSTLLDLPRLLTDKDFRKQILTHVHNASVREFWQNEFDRYSAWFRNEATSPILNKVGQFLTNVPIRRIINHPKSSFNLRDLMDRGKILIANLAKGRIGEDSSSLLGAMLVTQIHLAALERSDVPEHQRRPFYVYIDEVQSFLTGSYADILSESRKFGLSLTMSHQYLAQLEENIRSAILGNVGTMLVFRVGAEDAQYLVKELAPVAQQEDLISLPNYHLYIRLMIDGVTSAPFSAVTWQIPEQGTSSAERVIEASRRMYAVRSEPKQIFRNWQIDEEPDHRQPKLF